MKLFARMKKENAKRAVAPGQSKADSLQPDTADATHACCGGQGKDEGDHDSDRSTCCGGTGPSHASDTAHACCGGHRAGN